MCAPTCRILNYGTGHVSGQVHGEVQDGVVNGHFSVLGSLYVF